MQLELLNKVTCRHLRKHQTPTACPSAEASRGVPPWSWVCGVLWHWVGVGHGAATLKTEPLVPRDCRGGGVQGLQFTGEKAAVFGLFWKGRISGEGQRTECPTGACAHGFQVCKSGSCPFWAKLMDTPGHTHTLPHEGEQVPKTGCEAGSCRLGSSAGSNSVNPPGWEDNSVMYVTLFS